MSLESDVFQFPDEGSYLPEAMQGKRTNLMNEDWNNQDNIDSDNVPLRVLTNFTFFDPRTLSNVSLSCLSEGNGFCEGFGWASAVLDEDDQNDKDQDDDGILLHLSNIIKSSVDVHREYILVLTEYAWYILQTPSPTYRPFFIPFYTKETILRVVLRNILDAPALTLEDFLNLLPLPAARDRLLDRNWTEKDLISNFRYSCRELLDIVHDIPDVDWEDIKDSPLLDTLIRDTGPSPRAQRKEKPPHDRNTSSRTDSPTPVAPAIPRRKKKTKIQTFSTAVSHTIHSLVSSFFSTKFTAVGQKPDFLDEDILSRGRPHDHIRPDFTCNLKTGDFVFVNEGNHWDESQIRFAQIVFLDSRRKKFHARWFIHGSQTVLGELAFGQELFLSIADECRDVAVDCVVGTCKVIRLSLKERSNLQWPAKDAYFFSSAWDRKNPADFLEVKNDQASVSSARFCKSCDSRKSAFSYHLSGSHIVINDHEYHKHDFILYQAADNAQLTCSFGQIITFHDFGGTLQIKVYRLGRMSDKITESFCTENELFMTRMEVIVNPSRVLGRCQVTHISQIEDHLMDGNWLDQHPLSFYVQYQAESLDSALTPLPLTNLHFCDTCQRDNANLEKLDLQCRKDAPLRAFDPFCGVGGFGLGLARGCSMRTTHGVELDTSAAETMRLNFPSETIVLNKDASRALQHVAQGRPEVPQPGDIDLIYSGPPCQNDSTLNRHKTDRKHLAFTALSFLDMLRPSFFIMESVPGFLQRDVQGSAQQIRSGDLKLVLKALHFLGYNVVGRLLHARSFGDPQTRSRFFIVATLPESGDFKFPEPTHAFKPQQSGSPGLSVSLGTDFKVKAAVPRAGCALHKVVTISEALSDLPLFDWQCPRHPAASQDDTETISRLMNIPMVTCDPDEVWGIQDAIFQYNSPPANLFQRRARQDLGLTDPQYQHFTRHFVSHVVRNVCDIPIRHGADYRHLEQMNREWSLRDPASAQAIRGYQSGAYTRLDPNGYFHTIVTNVGPTAKQSAVLHPICKRILTVRETARAQGFPDDFIFYSETDSIDDYHKQIGNSVPFGMSTALGRSIQDVIFKQWKQQSVFLN